jgi:hypothetical protein
VMPWSFRGPVGGRIHLCDDRLHRAGRHRPRDVLTLRVVWVRVVCQRFFTLQSEHFRRQRNALRISEAPVEINDNAHAFGSSSTGAEGCSAQLLNTRGTAPTVRRTPPDIGVFKIIVRRVIFRLPTVFGLGFLARNAKSVLSQRHQEF